MTTETLTTEPTTEARARAIARTANADRLPGDVIWVAHRTPESDKQWVVTAQHPFTPKED